MVYSCCDDQKDCPCYTAEKSRPPAKPKQLFSHVITVAPGDTVFLCMCGQSESMPYCDASHGMYNKTHGTNIMPKIVKNDSSEKQIYHCCMCGHSKNRPFCDGTHRKVKYVE